jgi:hypothetical protein
VVSQIPSLISLSGTVNKIRITTKTLYRIPAELKPPGHLMGQQADPLLQLQLAEKERLQARFPPPVQGDVISC